MRRILITTVFAILSSLYLCNAQDIYNAKIAYGYSNPNSLNLRGQNLPNVFIDTVSHITYVRVNGTYRVTSNSSFAASVTNNIDTNIYISYYDSIINVTNNYDTSIYYIDTTLLTQNFYTISGGSGSSSSDSLLTPEMYGAIGDGNSHRINTVVDTSTDLTYTQVSAEAKWTGVKNRWKIVDLTITTYTTGATYTVTIGGTPYSVVGTTSKANTLNLIIAALPLSLSKPYFDADKISTDTIRIWTESSSSITVSSNMSITTKQSIVTRIDVTRDEIDWVAIQQMFYDAERLRRGVKFRAGATYCLRSKQVYLPIMEFNNTPFILPVKGNGCNFVRLEASGNDWFEQQMPSQRLAVSLHGNGIKWSESGFYYTPSLNPTAGNAGCVIRLRSASHSSLTDLFMRNVDEGIHLHFCMETDIRNIQAQYTRKYGLYVDYGDWYNTNASSSGSNVVTATNVHIQGWSGMKTMIYIRGVDCFTGIGTTLEGVAGESAITVDGTNSTTHHNIKFSQTHFEFTTNFSKACISITNGGFCVIEGGYFQAVTRWFESTVSGNNQLVFRDIEYTNGMQAVNWTDGWVRFDNCEGIRTAAQVQGILGAGCAAWSFLQYRYRLVP